MVVTRRCRGALVLLLLSSIAPSVLGDHAGAQTPENRQESRQRAVELAKQQKYTEALPLLERVAALDPNDPEIQFYLGFALIAQSNTITDAAAQKSLRVRARNAFIKAKELGSQQPIIDALIQSIPPDGSGGRFLSNNAEANRLMSEAEAYFARGKLDDALQAYKKAFQLDSSLYEAALFSGDVYTQNGDFEQAEVWYQKAIAINPNRETAYRYSATPFMRQGKRAQARDRYVEAYICEPYNRYTTAGLIQWARATNSKLAHPDLKIPIKVSFDEKGNAKIDLDSSVLLHPDDGSIAWLGYGATRTTWRKEKFTKSFPGEKTYRHTLAEETDALQSVLEIVLETKSVKTLSPSLTLLKQLNDRGLLEAFILLARADEGIAGDHPAYLKKNRDKLRRYVVEFMLAEPGK